MKKIRVKTTGEILNITEYQRIEVDHCDSYGTPIYFKPEEVEFLPDDEDAGKEQPVTTINQSDGIDWEQRRYDLSKISYQSLLNNHEWLKDMLRLFVCQEEGSENVENVVAHEAVAYADALIAELKKQKEGGKDAN